MRKETTAIYASGQTGYAYSSNRGWSNALRSARPRDRGDDVHNKLDETHCKNVFKNSTDINAVFSALWAKVINRLEYTKHASGLEDANSGRYNENMQSRCNHNQKIESCAQRRGADRGVSDE